jgi:hypothetical protein
LRGLNPFIALNEKILSCSGLEPLRLNEAELEIGESFRLQNDPVSWIIWISVFSADQIGLFCHTGNHKRGDATLNHHFAQAEAPL